MKMVVGSKGGIFTGCEHYPCTRSKCGHLGRPRAMFLAWRKKTKKFAQSKLCTQDRVVKRESASLLLNSVGGQETAM